MLRTLDRYILREILPPFLLGLLVFTFILEIPPIMEVAERLIAKGVDPPTIFRIMLTLLPQALGITIPMALLTGLLIGFGRMSGDREMVALQACGVSIFHLVRPVALLGVTAWAATSYIMIVALPDANQAFREITYTIVAARAEHEVRPRVFFEDFPSMVLYVRDVPPDGSGWRGVFLADGRQVGNPDVYVARGGRMQLDREARRVEMILEDGVRHRTPGDGPEKYEVFQFDRMAIRLDPDSVFPRSGPERGEAELTIPQLREQIAMLEAQGLSPHAPIMAIQRKFSIPIACLVFAVIGLALGVTSRRDGKLASFVLGIVVIFAYYVIMYTAEALAKAHVVPAALAMWLPNIVLGAAGVLLLVWRSRSAEMRIAVSLPLWRRAPEPSPATLPALRPAAKGPVVVIRIPHFWVPAPRILDWYISRLYLRLMGVAFLGMLGIFYIATFIDLSDKLFKGQTTGAMLLQYFWHATPQYVYYVLPIAALVSTLVTVGMLTKTSELVVMKACGVSLYRASASLLVFAVAWSTVLFGLEESILAESNRRAEAIRHVIRTGTPRTFNVLDRKWLIGRNGDIYHYAYFDPQRNELNGLSIYQMDADDWQVSERIFASQVAYDGTWHARQGWVREFGPDAPKSFRTFDLQELPVEPPEYFATEQPDAERMTYGELRRYIDELRTSGYNVVPYAVALQRKLSFPLVTVVMTLLGVPFAVTTGRRGALYGVGIGLVLAITYWILISVFGAIGAAGLLDPVIAAWAPNVLFGAGAAYFLLSVRT